MARLFHGNTHCMKFRTDWFIHINPPYNPTIRKKQTQSHSTNRTESGFQYKLVKLHSSELPTSTSPLFIFGPGKVFNKIAKCHREGGTLELLTFRLDSAVVTLVTAVPDSLVPPCSSPQGPRMTTSDPKGLFTPGCLKEGCHFLFCFLVKNVEPDWLSWPQTFSISHKVACWIG